MTEWDRLYCAVDGGMPDRVPAVPKIWVDLAAALTHTPLVEVVRSPEVALRVVFDAGLRCGVDAVRLFHFPPRRLVEGETSVYEVDAEGAVLGEVDMQGGLHTHLRDGSLFDIRDPYRMAHHHYWSAPSPFVDDEDDARSIAVPTAAYYEELGWGARLEPYLGPRTGGGPAIVGDCSSGTMAFVVCMRGMTRALMDLIENQALVHRIMEKGVAIAVEKAKFNIDRGLRVLRLNDSVGNMSVMSPQHWREFVAPHMSDFCTEVHRYRPEARIYCHICGNVLPIAEDLVKTGLDCIGPLDPMGGLTPGDMRHRVGSSVALMGGVDTLSFLNKTPEEIVEEGRRCIEEAGADGAFILGSGCVVPRAAPLEAVAALRTAVDRFGVYRTDED